MTRVVVKEVHYFDLDDDITLDEVNEMIVNGELVLDQDSFDRVEIDTY